MNQRFGGVYQLVCLGVLLLTACTQTSAPTPYDIFAEAVDIPILTTQALAAHGIAMNRSGLATLSEGEDQLKGLHVHTVTVNDFYDQPFTNVTFATPQPVTDLWQYAASLRGSEWDVNDFDGDYFTILTGATTARDGLISVSPGLSLLSQFQQTLQALGGLRNFERIIATDLQNFVMRSKDGQLWSIEAARALTQEETDALKAMYDDILDNLNTPEIAAQLRENWQDLLMQSEAQQQRYGYNLADFADAQGNLDLQQFYSFVDSRLIPQVGNSQRECWLFICSVVEWGHIPDNRQVPIHPFVPTRWDGSAVVTNWFGGFIQEHELYFRGSGRRDFNMTYCVSGQATQGPLGCGPSAFIGLLLRQYELGHRFGRPTKEAFLQWLVQPARVNGQIVNNGRPMIANYMGTCILGAGDKTGGLTTGGGFATGAMNFLRDNNASLRLDYNISSYAGNGTAAAEKARLIVRNIGRNDGRENPVLALYFIGGGVGHFAPITHYRNMWQGTVNVTIKTTDHNDRYYSLSGFWGTQRGVYALVPR
jgi:hypothetical protein